MKTICMLSDMHPLQDDRIYWKEAVSLKNNGYHIIHIGFGNESFDRDTAEGIRLISLRKKSFSNNIFLHKIIKMVLFIDPYKEMMKRIMEVKADAYHIHDLKVNRIGKRILRLPWNPKVIYDVHEDYGEIIRYHFNKNFLIRIFASAYAGITDRCEKRRTGNYDQYIHVTGHIQRNFFKRNPGVPSEIIFNYSDLTPAAEKEKKYDVVYSGLMSPNRGIIEILKAVSIVRMHYPGITFLFIGKFNSTFFQDQFLEMIKTLKVEENVKLQEFVGHNQMAEFYKESRIGLCTLHPAEHFIHSIPIKIFEYMTFGIPVIGSNFGEIEKYIRENDCGIPVDPLDPREIATALLKILGDEGLFSRFSRNGAEAAIKKFHWRNEEKKLINIYKNLFRN